MQALRRRVRLQGRAGWHGFVASRRIELNRTASDRTAVYRSALRRRVCPHGRRAVWQRFTASASASHRTALHCTAPRRIASQQSTAPLSAPPHPIAPRHAGPVPRLSLIPRYP
ncbi:hypothetical protein WS67_00425 [Burkholderia singularis]|uniref:Uncharacterized protein n=1 Tax=Burkholderia singularis TaxID=1503053 RepID=A0A103E7C0_9BURK|nr:hypothetical protein WS67_00425 [Burkholderia singularis]